MDAFAFVYIHRHECTLLSRKGMPCAFYIYSIGVGICLLISLGAMDLSMQG